MCQLCAHRARAPSLPQIKYTGFRDRPHEERQARFQNACRDGRSEIAFVATGTNLSLQFFPANLHGEQRQAPTREYVDFEREAGKVAFLPFSASSLPPFRSVSCHIPDFLGDGLLCE
ncbi:hypothetical protein Z043_104763 [Scleropages formosus]|uniref:Core-binding factor subunit beta-like n=1 Tax=Scleropages formosus TaxID=113540 RepID=A0A0P7UN63_SCLFO|nr:hypothetical protein Z043_104763 [Scleropages formosus]